MRFIRKQSWSSLKKKLNFKDNQLCSNALASKMPNLVPLAKAQTAIHKENPI